MINYNSKSEKWFRYINYALIALMLILILYPMVYILIASFIDPNELLSNGIRFNLKSFNLEGYKLVLKDRSIWIGYRNSLFYSFAYSSISTAIVVMAAYPLSRNDLPYKKFFTIFFIITMFFNGGLIPSFLVVKNLGMLNTIWAILIPKAVNVFHLILAMTFFKSISKELREAAALDGANDFTYFFKILIPLSKPIIAVLFIYSFVNQWNSYFDALIYLDDQKLYPLQLVLRRILIQNDPQPGMISNALAMAELKRIAEMIKYAVIVISSLPLLVMYPFFQKYFEKGTMIGSIKG